MTLNHSLSAIFKDPLLRETDSDGDTCIDGSLIIKTLDKQTLDFFIAQCIVRNSDGGIVCSSRDEREDCLSDGEELSIDLNKGYFKANTLGNSAKVRVDVDLLGCKANYAQLPSIHLGDGSPGLYGLNQEISLGENITIQSLAVAVKAPDEDGDVRIELRALIRNASTCQIPKFELKARAIGSGGREIDDTYTYETIAPSERKVIELSFYSIKANRMRGLSISADATAFIIQGKGNASCEVSTTN